MYPISRFQFHIGCISFFYVIEIDLNDNLFAVFLANDFCAVGRGEFSESTSQDTGAQGGESRLVIVEPRFFDVSAT